MSGHEQEVQHQLQVRVVEVQLVVGTWSDHVACGTWGHGFQGSVTKGGDQAVMD